MYRGGATGVTDEVAFEARASKRSSSPPDTAVSEDGEHEISDEGDEEQQKPAAKKLKPGSDAGAANACKKGCSYEVPCADLMLPCCPSGEQAETDSVDSHHPFSF